MTEQIPPINAMAMAYMADSMGMRQPFDDQEQNFIFGHLVTFAHALVENHALDVKSAVELLAREPHSTPHVQGYCVRCACRAVLRWADCFPPFENAALESATPSDARIAPVDQADWRERCNEIAALTAERDALQVRLDAAEQDRDAFRAEADAVRRNYLRETKDLAERGDAWVKVELLRWKPPSPRSGRS